MINFMKYNNDPNTPVPSPLSEATLRDNGIPFKVFTIGDESTLFSPEHIIKDKAIKDAYINGDFPFNNGPAQPIDKYANAIDVEWTPVEEENNASTS